MIVSKQGGVSPLALHEGGFQWEVPYPPMDTKGVWGLENFGCQSKGMFHVERCPVIALLNWTFVKG